MLSVVMPYWDRESLLRRTLTQFERLYSSLKMEVVVANDGSKEPRLDAYPFPVKIVSLPEKDTPKNPCVPINRGVEESSGGVIVITNPEIYHPEPIFPKMMEELIGLGGRGYVLAACKGEKRFHCHSTKKAPGQDRIPDGSGLHFCAMMYRSFFDEIGGFDEDYRNGAGYDDNDFAWRIHRGKGKVKIRDDLVVTHVKTGVRWGMSRNRQLFYSKWTDYWNQLSS